MVVNELKRSAIETVAETVNNLLAHYVSLARQPGWKAYAWHRVNEMAKDSPELFGDFPQRLVAEVKTI